MNDIIELLTTEECIIIYTITAILCLISFLIYTFDSNKDRRRKKQNTKELNKLVDQIEEDYNEYDYDYNQVPQLETIEPIKYDKKDEFIDKIAPHEEMNHLDVEEEQEETVLEQMVTEVVKTSEIVEKKDSKIKNDITLEIKKEEDSDFYEEELEYTTIEPNREEAIRELEELPEKIKQDEKKKEEFFNDNNIELTEYEIEQEENAIISLEELNKKSEEMYTSNEINLEDEGNEPISLKDLEAKMNKQLKVIAENFEINKVVETPTQEEISKMLEDSIPVPLKPKEEKNKIKMDDFNTIRTSNYHPTPVISPIFGIEKNYKTDLELENTANYDKLDAEIKKTNEFMMTLKELQQQQE